MFPRLIRTTICALSVLAAGAPAAWAQAGGLEAPGDSPPQLLGVQCPADGSWTCHRGDQAALTGSNLAAVRAVVLLGAAGTRDDRTVRPVRRFDGTVAIRIPAGARSGPIKLRSDATHTSQRPLRITTTARPGTAASTPAAAAIASPAPAVPGALVFPIGGPHDFGQTATNNFGGGRGHQGQDLFTACGTPLVAVRDATVQRVAFQSAAGNYVVLQDDAGQSYVYMHMLTPATVSQGARVSAGQPLGAAGVTGRATGCQLHFELWSAPGWYTGGSPMDPLPELRRWAQGT